MPPPHLLHIDSSIQGEHSVSRALTARAVAVWRSAHPDGTVTYRDLGADPLAHLDFAGLTAHQTPAEKRTPEQASAWELSRQLVGEVLDADTIVLGMPLYNHGAPSNLKVWVDRLVALGLSFNVDPDEGLLAGRDLVVLASRGGGYGPGTPREGWDHAEKWLEHALHLTGLEPRFITAELTLANSVPKLAALKPLAAASLAAATDAIDQLWPAAGAKEVDDAVAL